jgi:hypothetical protein
MKSFDSKGSVPELTVRVLYQMKSFSNNGSVPDGFASDEII